ncbi:MAG: ComF family protein [Lachnospiraceae bacterium]
MYVLKELLFPRHCPICDGIVPKLGNLCCDTCLPKLQYVGENFCIKCGKKLQKEEMEYCEDCRKYEHIFERARSLFEYQSVAQGIFRFKYQNRQEYADFYGEMIYRYLKDWFVYIGADAIVPVPLHKSRMQERGYNQAQLIAQALSKRLHIPTLSKSVVRCKKTTPQKVLNRKERQNNLKKAFKIVRNDVKLKTVLIVDDIYTTGSTVDALAEVLLEAGAYKIFVVTLATGVA